MRNAGEQLLWDRMHRVRIMIHRQAFRPRFVAALVDLVPKRLGEAGIWIVVVARSNSDHDDSRIVEAGLPAYAVEF